MRLNFYIILILLFSFIAKADQIFELIKIPNLTLHKLEEFLEGEAFDDMIESLTLQAQEESLSNLE